MIWENIFFLALQIFWYEKSYKNTKVKLYFIFFISQIYFMTTPSGVRIEVRERKGSQDKLCTGQQKLEL